MIVVTGVDPILVTELSVIFSVVALPLTYIPILLVANDRAYMGNHANGILANVFGLLYLLVVLVIAAAAIPLLLLSNMGQG
jgi:Mn2+/Fe2+ NRAMP family transporter